MAYYRYMPGEADNTAVKDSESFKCKAKITGKSPTAGNTKYVEIRPPLKYLSNF